VLRLAFVLAVLLNTLSTRAQDVPLKIRVLNGITGQPLKSVPVRVAATTQMEVKTDREGLAMFTVPADATIRMTVPSLKSCSNRTPQGLLPDPKGILMPTVRLSGIVGYNACSSHGTRSRPGEIVVYMEPRHWYRRLLPI